MREQRLWLGTKPHLRWAALPSLGPATNPHLLALGSAEHFIPGGKSGLRKKRKKKSGRRKQLEAGTDRFAFFFSGPLPVPPALA